MGDFSGQSFRADALEHRPPEELVSEIIEKERRILEIMQEIQAELGMGTANERQYIFHSRPLAVPSEGLMPKRRKEKGRRG